MVSVLVLVVVDGSEWLLDPRILSGDAQEQEEVSSFVLPIFHSSNNRVVAFDTDLTSPLSL